jgi:hypothetical protein
MSETVQTLFQVLWLSFLVGRLLFTVSTEAMVPESADVIYLARSYGTCLCNQRYNQKVLSKIPTAALRSP